MKSCKYGECGLFEHLLLFVFVVLIVGGFCLISCTHRGNVCVSV